MEAFREDSSEGLFELAARPVSGGLPPQLAYWRDFAARYLGERCHTPAGTADPPPVAPPGAEDVAMLLLSAPPMQGAEYLTEELLRRMWTDLDAWTCARAAHAGGLEAFLSEQAPLWRQVGRVCFHLAENKRDPAFPFAFLATYAPRVSASTGIRYQPLARALQELAGARNRKALVHLLTPVERAAEASPLIRALVDSRDIYHPLAWTSDDAYRFLQEVPLYEQSGVLVRVPDWWARRSRPMVAVRIGSKSQGILGMDALLDFRVEVAVGDASLTEGEIRRLLAGTDGLVFLKGRWVEVDKKKLSQALEHWERMKEATGEGISFAEGMRLLAGASQDLAAPQDSQVAAWSVVEAGAWLSELLGQLRSPEALASALPGRELRATLRHYQETGVRWLRLLSGLGLGACLADDMGLGKTIQVLGLLLLLRKKDASPSLLVLPASLLANWKAEIERFAPSLRARFLHPSFGPLPSSPVAANDLADADVVLTTYGMVTRQPWLESVSWNLLVLDEAQAIKNPGARQTRAVKRLRARARIALTGTPVENRLSDLWSLFDFLCPGLLGSLARFSSFAKELEEKHAERFLPHPKSRAAVHPADV